MSVIQRAENPKVERLESEVQAAYIQAELPRRNKVCHNWYGGIYDYYQSNEC